MRAITIWGLMLLIVGTAVRSAVAEGESLAGLINDLKNLKPSTSGSLSPGLGFQKGDSAAVDPRLLDTEQLGDHDGTKPMPGMAVGKGVWIGSNTGQARKGAGEPTRFWTITKFATRQDASNQVARYSDTYKESEKRGRELDPKIWENKVQSRYSAEEVFYYYTERYVRRPPGTPEHTTAMNVVLYRDVFVIAFGGWEFIFDYDFPAEQAKAVEKSKKLIDLRFPPEK